MEWGSGGHGGQHDRAPADGRQQTLHTGSNPTGHSAQGARPRTGLQHWLGGGGHALEARQVGTLQGRDDGLAVPAGGVDVAPALRRVGEPALQPSHLIGIRHDADTPNGQMETLHKHSGESRMRQPTALRSRT